MSDALVALVVDESKWLTASMACALLAVGYQAYRYSQANHTASRRVQAAMNLFFGVTIGVMATGHLLAVSTKLEMGTLEGNVSVLVLIGIALAVPSWWLVYHTRKVLPPAATPDRATVGLNAWLVITLIALGVHNLPLALPGLLNIAYHLLSGRAARWAIAGTAVVVNAGLFVGSLVFLISGQSFEQFSGMQ